MISVRMIKDWEYEIEEARGTARRTLPKGLVLELDDDVAAAAVAGGHAETTRAQSPEFLGRVERHKQIIDMLAAGLSVDDVVDEMMARGAATVKAASVKGRLKTSAA